MPILQLQVAAMQWEEKLKVNLREKVVDNA